MPAKLQEILIGPQAAIYGALPKVALPGDDETLLRFAKELAELLKDKGIYRRDATVVYPYQQKARLHAMTAHAFRTFIDEFVACSKQKFDNNGEPYDVIRSVNKETAQGVLEAYRFWSELHEIIAVEPLSVPVEDEGGNVSLLDPGYDPKTKTLTFG
jgi:hypothetical protein